MMRRRILHIAKVTGVAGAEKHLLSLLPSFDADQFEVEFLALVTPDDRTWDYIAHMQARSVPTHVLRFTDRWGVALAPRLYGFLRSNRHDIVHTHFPYAELVAAPFARLCGVPVIISTLHGYRHYPPNWKYRTMSALSWRFHDAIICISNSLRAYLTGVGVPPARLHVVSYGLETPPDPDLRKSQALRHRWTGDSSGPIIGVVARLEPIKGHRVLLEALPAIIKQFPQVRLVLIGDGPTRQPLALQARSLGIERHVVFEGFRSDIDDCVEALDVLVLPSLAEGFGLVLLEAMAHAKPVVASATTAIPEIVTDGQTGLLVSPHDSGEFSRALLSVLTDPALALRLGSRGRERVQTLYTVTRMVAQTQELYSRLLVARLQGDADLRDGARSSRSS